MQNRKRLTNMLIAGTLTVLALTVFLAFRGNTTAVAATTASEQTAVIDTAVSGTADTTALQSQVQVLQAQNEELRSAVQVLQEREVEYQRQIEIANQTISELSAQTGSLATGEEASGLFAFRAPHSHEFGGHDH